MELTKLRYSVKEAQALLSIANTSFWARVAEGALKLHGDGGKRFVSAAELLRYLKAREESPLEPSTIAQARKAIKRAQSA